MKMKNPAGDEGAEFDLTPMIDIVFLLIAFFMIVAAVLTLDRQPIDTPVAPRAKIPEEFGQRTTITVDREGTFYSGLRPITLDEIRAIAAEEYKRKGQEVKIYLRGDKHAEHQYVNDVMSACAAAGISKVIFATFQSPN